MRRVVHKMRTEAKRQTGGVRRTSRSPKAAKTSRTQPALNERQRDLIGIGFLGLAAILGALLVVPEGGIVGSLLVGAFRSLFGVASWTAPLIVGALGVSYLIGREGERNTRAFWGMVIMSVGILGILASARQGDYFDPEIARTSGGYIGAIAASMTRLLLGGAQGVALGALIAIGGVLCMDAPVQLIRTLIKRRREAPKNSKLANARKEAERITQATQEALVAALDPMDDHDDVPSYTVIEEEPLVEEDEGDDLMAGATVRGSTVKEPELLDTRTSDTGYELPSLTLLDETVQKAKKNMTDVQRGSQILQDTLHEFGIDAKVAGIATGPTVTRYEVTVGKGVRVNRVTALADNIALNLAAETIRVEAPIPGRSAIGIEVPAKQRSVVGLRELCECLEFFDEDRRLCVALGKDVSGGNVYTDLTRMPHLLIGGATNSGKSIGLATIIMSLILRHTPKELRLVMIDPKRVELNHFEALPHLMCPVVTDVKEAAGVLRAVWREMDRRYDKFSDAGVRNIEGWNAKATYSEKLPYIVVIVDELADLMMSCANEVEASICRLAQLARATGIHLVIATQRPSVDVITGTIKANISSRMAFAVSSQIDSRTILDQPGAEKLIGKGDMLFLPIDANKPLRVQGCYVDEGEIERVCNFWRDQQSPNYVIDPSEVAITEGETGGGSRGGSRGEDVDEFWEQAVRFVVERNQASTSMLQRKFSIGFQRASRLLDEMEERGIVGPRDGPRPRDILVDPSSLELMFGDLENLPPVPDGAMLDDD